MLNALVSRMQKTSLWHLVWISIIASEILTAGLVSLLSYLLHGEVRGDFLFTGAVTALLVSLAVVSLIVAFLGRLRESEDLNIQVMKSVGEGLAVFGEDGTIRFANQYLCGIFGYADGTLDGADFNILVAQRHRPVQGGAGPSAGRRTEMEGVGRDGQTFPIEIRIEESLAAEGQRLFTAAVRDITARKLTDERLRLLALALESVGDAVAVTDTAGKIEYVNRAFTGMMGYELAEVAGKGVSILNSGRQQRDFFKEMWETALKGQVWRGRIVNRKKDGTFIELDMAIAPAALPDGAATHYVSVWRDLTREEMLERSKRYFTTVASHELATPITQLVLVDNLLASPGRDLPEIRESLKGAIADLRRIFTATSLLAALEMPSTARRVENTYISFLIQSVVDEGRREAGHAGRRISVTLDISPFNELTAVEGGKQFISASLEEVLSNAIKFTPDGGTVSVRGWLEKDRAVVEVLDEGEGIPEAASKELFRPYFSSENTLVHSTGRYRYKGGGMGLGLAIVHLAAKRQGGQVEIGGRPDGKGTRVALGFPLADS